MFYDEANELSDMSGRGRREGGGGQISLSHAAIFGWHFSRGLRDKST